MGFRLLLVVAASSLFAMSAAPAGASTRYSQVSAGYLHSCGLVSGGSVKCWGQPWSGEDIGSTPRSVPGIDTATAIGSGYAHSCALMSAGGVRCWGLGTSGQLGSGGFESSSTPVAVTGVWTAKQISVSAHSCAVMVNKTIKCWGFNAYGQLGDGSVNQSSPWAKATPVTVSGITNAVQVSTGAYTTCAVLEDGTVACWGEGGILGNGLKASSAVPVTVSGITNAVQVDVGSSFACALLADGSIRCWGASDYGQLGDGSICSEPGTWQCGYAMRLTPVRVSGIDNATRISSGDWSSCAVLATRRVKCWGAKGAIGDGAYQYRPTPVDVLGITDATQVTVGGFHACARLIGGALRCWGRNYEGQIGNGAPTGNLADLASPVPVVDTSTEDGDTDGDGLPDSWESEPVDTTGDGVPDLDLPAMGASPDHKDLFVELDAMPGLRLSQEAINGVVKAFNDSPVSNPDGQPGIRLHVDNGPSSVMNPISGETWASLSRANEIPWKQHTGTEIPAPPGNGSEYDWSEFDAIRAANFDPLRARVFRYALSVNRSGSPTETSGGIARDIPSTDFIVSLGHECRPEGKCLGGDLSQAAVFMHEMGHTLGLRHGGNEDVNKKPNYLSVMNYLFSYSGLLRSDLPAGQGLLDYSRFGPSDLPTLDETNLSESAGISSSPNLANYRTLIKPRGAAYWKRVPVVGPIDFSFDGDTNDVSLSDINFDTDYGMLSTFADWPNLVYKAGAIGLPAVQSPPAPPDTTANDEPTLGEIKGFANIASSPPVVKTTSATSITQTSAKLNGTVNPTGQATDVQFTYGTTADNTRLTTFTSAGKGTKTIAFSRTITGLVGDTTYTVSAVARTGTQLVYGSPVTFKTTACSKLSTRSKRESCVLAREQFKCQAITNPAQKTTCLANATATAGRTR